MKPSPEHTPPPAERIAGTLDYARVLLPLALEAAGQFRRKLRVDTLELELRLGGDDPCEVAGRYGWANAALGAIWGPLQAAFQIENGRARVEADFSTRETCLNGRAALSLKLGQILRLGVHFGYKALREFYQVRKQHRGAQAPGKAGLINGTE